MKYSAEYVTASLGLESFARLLEEMGSTHVNRNTRRANCPVHKGDSNDSLSYNEKGGTILWTCFSGCGGQGGSPFTMVEHVMGIGFEEAVDWLGEFLGLQPDVKQRSVRYTAASLAAEFGGATPASQFVSETSNRFTKIWSSFATNDAKGEEYLSNRGLSASSVARFNTGKSGDKEVDGYAAGGYRIAVPLRDHETGSITSFQFRLAAEPISKDGRKVMTLRGSLNGSVFGPEHGVMGAGKNDVFVVVEGLTDFLAISALDLGLTDDGGRIIPIGFPGAGGSRKLATWGSVLMGRKIFIAMDQDSVGEKTSALLARELLKVGAVPYRIRFTEKDLSARLQKLSERFSSALFATDVLMLMRDASSWGAWDPGPQEGEKEPSALVGNQAVSASDFCKEAGDDVEWLIKPWLPAGAIGVLVASGGVGKTTMLTQLGLSAARGEGSLWGFLIEKPVSVLYIAAEGARSLFRQRFLVAAKSIGIQLEGLPWYIQSAECKGYEIGTKVMDELIVSSKAKLVILDTLGYFWRGDENSAVEWKAKVMAPLRRMTAAHRCSFLLVHHNSKMVGFEGEGWKKGRGTAAMHDDSDFYLRMEKVKAEDGGDSLRRDLWIDKNKYGPLGYSVKLIFDTRTATFRQE